jgi:hypothetical protein
VYERVSGASIPVKDPARLAELYSRGRAARDQAQAWADNLCSELIADDSHRGSNPDHSRFALALSTTGYPSDVRSRIFTQVYEAEVEEIVRAALIQLPRDVPPPHPVVSQPQQDSLKLWTTRPHQFMYEKLWTVRVHWSGTVAIQYQTPIEPVLVHELADGAIKDAWDAAAQLVLALKGYGPAYMTLSISGAKGTRDRWGNPLQATVRQGPFGIEPTEEMLARVKRELQRSAGEHVYEPDPSEGQGQEDDPLEQDQPGS